MENKIEIRPHDAPWEIACALIGAEYKAVTNLGETYFKRYFTNKEIGYIGEYLLNYSKFNKGREGYERMARRNKV